MALNWSRTQTYTAIGRKHYYTIHGDDGEHWSVAANEDGWTKFGPRVHIGAAGTLDEAFAVAEQHNNEPWEGWG